MSNPHTSDMEAALHVLRYLKNNPSQGILRIKGLIFLYKPIVTHIWLLVHKLDILLVDFISHWATLLCPGNLKNKAQFL